MKRIKYLLAMSLMLIAQAAYADFMTPPANDALMKLWQNIFGNLIHGGSGTGLSSILMPFITVVGVVGCVICLHNYIVGTVGTAHDGQVMGKWNAAWLPIRMVVGLCLILPVGGITGGQQLVGWVATQGVAVADKMNDVYVDKNNSGTITPPDVPDATPLATQILHSEVCMDTNNKELQEADGLVGHEEVKRSTFTANGYLNVVWGSGGDNDDCGGYRLPVGSSNPGIAAIQNAKIAASATMEKSISSLANAIATDQASLPHGVLQSTLAAYQTNVKNIVTSTSIQPDANQAALNQARKDKGFIYSGSFYQNLAKKRREMSSAASAGASLMPVRDGIKDMIFGNPEFAMGVRSHGKKADEYIHNELDVANVATSNSSSEPSQDAHMTAFYMKAGGIIAGTRQGLEDFLTTDDVFLHSADWGFRIMDAGGLVMGARAVIGLGLSLIPTETIGPAFLAATKEPAQTIFKYTFLIGSFLGIYMPLIPLLTMYYFAIRLTIILAEGFIGAPLWGLAYLLPEGDDFKGQAGHGYKLLANLLLLPALGFFFFAFAALALNPTLKFFIGMLEAHIKGLDLNSLSAILSFISFIAAVALVIFSTTLLYFSAVVYAPHGALEWMASHLGSHHSQDHARSAGDQIAGAVGMGAAVGALAGAGGGKSSKDDSKKPNKKGKDDNVITEGEADHLPRDPHKKVVDDAFKQDVKSQNADHLPNDPHRQVSDNARPSEHSPELPKTSDPQKPDDQS